MTKHGLVEKPGTMCAACGRVGRRGFMRIGGLYPQPAVFGEWWRSHFIPTVYVCSARLACMRRIYDSAYSRDSFNEQTQQDYQERWRARTT